MVEMLGDAVLSCQCTVRHVTVLACGTYQWVFCYTLAHLQSLLHKEFLIMAFKAIPSLLCCIQLFL